LVTATGSIDRSVERLAVIANNAYPPLHELIARQPGLLGQFTGDGRQRLAVFGSNLPLVLKGIARATQEGSYVNGYICDINSTVFAFISRVIPAVTRLASPGNMTEHSPICQ
jgi:phospholipid/cholesterol/gamma-HCH transport system substrate-binding protein